MENLDLEVVKKILIERIKKQLLRKDTIDLEIQKMSQLKTPDIDINIIQLERKINQKLGLLDRIIHSKEYRQSTQQLTNLKVQKTIFYTTREQNIENLLKEKEFLAYNEYNYEKRILEIENSQTFLELNMTADEKAYLELYQGTMDNNEEERVR